MPPRKKTLSTDNSMAVLVGKLQAQMEDQTKFRDTFMELQYKQVRLLDELKQEAQLSNQRICSSMEALANRISDVEPVVKKLDNLRERGFGMLVMGLLAISLITSGIVSASKSALHFLGIDLS